LLQSGAENVTNRSGTSYPTLLEGDERQLENWVAGCAVSNGRVIVGAGSDTPQIACAAIYQYQASGQARITLPASSKVPAERAAAATRARLGRAEPEATKYAARD